MFFHQTFPAYITPCWKYLLNSTCQSDMMQKLCFMVGKQPATYLSVHPSYNPWNILQEKRLAFLILPSAFFFLNIWAYVGSNDIMQEPSFLRACNTFQARCSQWTLTMHANSPLHTVTHSTSHRRPLQKVTLWSDGAAGNRRQKLQCSVKCSNSKTQALLLGGKEAHSGSRLMIWLKGRRLWLPQPRVCTLSETCTGVLGRCDLYRVTISISTKIILLYLW